MFAADIGRITLNRTHTYAQRKEDLTRSCQPHFGIPNAVKIRGPQIIQTNRPIQDGPKFPGLQGDSFVGQEQAKEKEQGHPYFGSFFNTSRKTPRQNIRVEKQAE